MADRSRDPTGCLWLSRELAAEGTVPGDVGERRKKKLALPLENTDGRRRKAKTGKGVEKVAGSESLNAEVGLDSRDDEAVNDDGPEEHDTGDDVDPRAWATPRVQ